MDTSTWTNVERSHVQFFAYAYFFQKPVEFLS